MNGHGICLSENPEYPYIAVGYNDGKLELISAFNAENLKTLVSFKLCSTPFDTVKFFENGRMIVTGNTLTGTFFILEVSIACI